MSNVTDPFAEAVQAVTEAVRLAIADPAEQIRRLSPLAAFSATALPGISTINAAVQTATDATAALARRAALTSLARATAAYSPTSSADAQVILSQVAPLYDAEITYAADNGDTRAYMELRQLRAAVVTDLETRAASLPELRTITRNDPMPSLLLAWQLYADATRNVDLVARNPSVPHPGFFPAAFEALSA